MIDVYYLVDRYFRNSKALNLAVSDIAIAYSYRELLTDERLFWFFMISPFLLYRNISSNNPTQTNSRMLSIKIMCHLLFIAAMRVIEST